MGSLIIEQLQSDGLAHHDATGVIGIETRTNQRMHEAPELHQASADDHYGQTEMGMLVNNQHHPDLKKALRSGSMGQARSRSWRYTTICICCGSRPRLRAPEYLQINPLGTVLVASAIMFFPRTLVERTLDIKVWSRITFNMAYACETMSVARGKPNSIIHGRYPKRIADQCESRTHCHGNDCRCEYELSRTRVIDIHPTARLLCFIFRCEAVAKRALPDDRTC